MKQKRQLQRKYDTCFRSSTFIQQQRNIIQHLSIQCCYRSLHLRFFSLSLSCRFVLFNLPVMILLVSTHFCRFTISILSIYVCLYIYRRQRKFPAFFVVTLIENGANWKSVRIKLTASDNSNRKRLIQKAFCTVHLVECSCSHSFRITLSLRYSLSFYLVCFVFALK